MRPSLQRVLVAVPQPIFTLCFLAQRMTVSPANLEATPGMSSGAAFPSLSVLFALFRRHIGIRCAWLDRWLFLQ